MHIPCCLFTHQLMETWLFPFLVIVNNVTVTISTQVLCGYMFSFLLGVYLGVELISHTVTLHLLF